MGEHADIESPLFKIALVCTGNRCRSPIAEALIKQHAADLPIQVRSAGLLDLGQAPSLPQILELGSAHGLDAHIGASQSAGPR